MNELDDDGRTPFMASCFNGHTHVLDWMMSHGVAEDHLTKTGNILYINTVSINLYAYADRKYQFTPFSHASYSGQVAVLNWLIEHGLPISQMAQPCKN